MLDVLSKAAKAAFLPWSPPRKEPAILERFFLVFIIPAVFALIVVGNWPEWGNYAIATAFAVGIWLCLKTIRW